MLARKEQKNSGNPIKTEWTNELAELLRTTYKEQCKKSLHDFQVYGFHYPDEVLLITSFMDKNNVNKAPVTIFISADLINDQEPDKLLNTLIDTTGLFFDHYFATDDWDEWQHTWQEDTVKGITLYYRITRENIDLTLMADKLLENDLN